MFFDAARRQTCEVKQNLTNTPLHALTTLNDITYVEAARVLAERMIQQASSAQARIAGAFETLTARQPDAAETQLLARRLAGYIDQFKHDPAAAARLLAVGEAPRDTALDPAEHAAYTTLFNTLLNLDETLVKP
jgi:hypothetical protein